MRPIRTMMLGAVLVAAGGCERLPGTPQNDAVLAVRSQMLDPQAARIEIRKTGPGGVCGTVNGKNAMGGYVGVRPFVVQGVIARIYSEPPSRDDVRMLLRMDKGADRDDLVVRIGVDCDLPRLWREICGTPFLADEGDAHLCQLWTTGKTAKLFDEVGG